MNISILNALWSILVGEKLDLDDPKLAKVIEMFDYFLRNIDGTQSAADLLPHPSMSKWPVIRKLTGYDLADKTFKAMEDFIEPYVSEHKRTLDPDNIPDFVDLMLCEIENTTNPESSFYGEKGELSNTNVFFINKTHF
jgi:hypothetical protein